MPTERYNRGTGPKIPKSDQDQRGQREDRRSTGRSVEVMREANQGRIFLLFIDPPMIIELDLGNDRSLIEDVLPFILFLMEMDRMGETHEETPSSETSNRSARPGSRQ